MTEFLSKHSIKIQLGALASMFGLIIYWTYTASAMVFQLDENTKKVENLNTFAERVVILETKVNEIKDDVGEVKADIKTLLKNQ